ncbi:recombinase RecT [Clostridium botulinum]|uniref:recombinase RecT n=1 Tax=Clostridium botulinum TaxID=1491 RepID=UPI000A9B99BD|nr:recombinase RecT [Clostridium botulinum]MCC5418737.1 recombinase RecT [Clostridium botulinum]MCR1146978.1 recombinase RecT [Clostridium botulinum]
MVQGFNEARFLQNCMKVLKDTKNIEKCNEVSKARTMLKGAFLGLELFNKEPVYLNLF